MSLVKPTFGASSSNTSSGQGRPEIGVIWNRTSTSKNLQFMNIKVKLSKEKLTELLSTNDNEVTLDLVAFPNREHNGNDRRPNYRIYESVKKSSDTGSSE